MATATFTEVVDRSIGDPLTEAIWDDQLKDNINQLAGAHRNLLTNGGFEVWQRGAGAFTASGAYTADRWVMVEVASTISVTQEPTTIDSSGQYALACAYTHGSTSNINQTVENWRDCKGKTISLSMRLRQTVASMARLFVNDGTTVTTGSTTVTTGSFVTHTLSVAIPSNATQLVVGVQLLVTGTVYLDNAMLVIGPAPAPYQPLHPQEDLARCQRYYEVHGGLNNGSPSPTGWASGAAQYVAASVAFNVAKYGTPTLTKNGTWGVTACNQPTAAQATPTTYVLYTTSTGAASLVTTFPNGTDDTITAESNP